MKTYTAVSKGVIRVTNFRYEWCTNGVLRRDEIESLPPVDQTAYSQNRPLEYDRQQTEQLWRYGLSTQ